MQVATATLAVTTFNVYNTLALRGFMGVDTVEVRVQASDSTYVLIDKVTGCFPKTATDYTC